MDQHGSSGVSSLEELLRQLVREAVEEVLAERLPAASPADDHLLTVAQAASYLGLTEPAVRMKVRRKQLPSTRLGRLVRFRRDELDAFLKDAA